MLGFEIFLDDDYKGFGHSEGLARGLQIRVDGENLTQEGMGIGTIALKDKVTTVFSKEYRDLEIIDPEIANYHIAGQSKCRIYFLDAALKIGMKSIPFLNLTRTWDNMTEYYKSHRKFQIFQLASGRYFDKLFQIERAFVKIEPRAEAKFCYDIVDTGVKVQTTIKMGDFTCDKICIMNEMGADWFSQARKNGSPVSLPAGWDQIDPVESNSLIDPTHNLGFTLKDIFVSGNLPFELFWGREKNSELCWTGFTIEISPSGVKNFPDEIQCTYNVVIERG